MSDGGPYDDLLVTQDHQHHWVQTGMTCLEACACGLWRCEGEIMGPGEHYKKHVVDAPPLSLDGLLISADWAATTRAEKLLLEWFQWWEQTDTAPPKMPDTLHIRTALYFSTPQDRR